MVVDYKKIDWNAVWQEAVARRRSVTASRGVKKDWNERASEFARNVSGSPYIDEFLRICSTWPQATVLDVGAAAGTLAVPLAGRVKKVTALEPAEKMREILACQCREKGIENIAIVDGRWESDWDEIEPHDIFIASRAMIVDDLHIVLEKIRRYALKRVYLAVLVGDGPFDRAIFEAVGRECVSGPDYIILYNFLRQQGICANIDFTCHVESRFYRDFDHAVKELSWMLPGMDKREEKLLRAYLEKIFVPEGDGVAFQNPRQIRWAVLWWNVEDV